MNTTCFFFVLFCVYAVRSCLDFVFFFFKIMFFFPIVSFLGSLFPNFLRIHIIHIDELKMTNRPDVEPAPTDTEIFADPLPDEDLMDTCVNAFGSTEEIYVLPSGPRRGYVKFMEHGAASRAVQVPFKPNLKNLSIFDLLVLELKL